MRVHTVALDLPKCYHGDYDAEDSHHDKQYFPHLKPVTDRQTDKQTDTHTHTHKSIEAMPCFYFA